LQNLIKQISKHIDFLDSTEISPITNYTLNCFIQFTPVKPKINQLSDN